MIAKKWAQYLGGFRVVCAQHSKDAQEAHLNPGRWDAVVVKVTRQTMLCENNYKAAVQSTSASMV
jgi:hypothetical protein